MIHRQPPYLPFLDGPVSIAPRLVPIAEANWLSPDTEAEPWLEAKHSLMRECRQLVFATCAEDPESASELAEMVASHLDKPAPIADWETPMEAASSMVSDDLCIMTSSNDRWILLEASVCAPTFWSLNAHIGRSVSGLHQMVPSGTPSLDQRIDRIFSNLESRSVLERFNWTVQFSDRRYTPSQKPLIEAMAQTALEDSTNQLYLRVERQTVRRLPRSGDILFTIRVCLDPLKPMLADDISREAFSEAWLNTNPAIREYKGWPHYDHVVSALLADLEAI